MAFRQPNYRDAEWALIHLAELAHVIAVCDGAVFAVDEFTEFSVCRLEYYPIQSRYTVRSTSHVQSTKRRPEKLLLGWDAHHL